MVPAGPYRLDDLRPTGNGDLVVTLEDDNGHKTVQVYPVTTLPTLLRPSDFQYDFAMGKKNQSNELNKAFSSDTGLFWLGSVDYGFSSATLNSAILLNNRYQSAGIGVTKSFGELGALSLSAQTAKARYNNGDEKKGQNVSIKYAKNFTDRTDLQLLTYRYQDKGYVDYAEFDPHRTFIHGNQKSRYEARLSHRFDTTYLSGAWWHQNYWDRDGSDTGATLSLSTSAFDSVSVFLNGSYNRYANTDKADYSASVSVSIPFDFRGYSITPVTVWDITGAMVQRSIQAFQLQ